MMWGDDRRVGVLECCHWHISDSRDTGVGLMDIGWFGGRGLSESERDIVRLWCGQPVSRLGVLVWGGSGGGYAGRGVA